MTASLVRKQAQEMIKICFYRGKKKQNSQSNQINSSNKLKNLSNNKFIPINWSQLRWSKGTEEKKAEIGETDGSQKNVLPVSLHLWLVCISSLPLFILSFHPFTHPFLLSSLIKAVWLETSDTFKLSSCDDLMRSNIPTEFRQINSHSPDLTWPAGWRI